MYSIVINAYFRCTENGFVGQDFDSATQLRCEASEKTGLFSPTCRFEPEKADKVSASILFAEYLDGVSNAFFKQRISWCFIRF